MARPAIGAPFELVLPSGVRGSLRGRVKTNDDGRRPRDLAEAIELGAVETTLELHNLPLADANVIEAVLAAMSVIVPERANVTCENCGEEFEVNAAAALPVAPLLEPLGDPELDPVVDRVEWHALPRPIAFPRRGTVDRFRLARRTFGDRLKLEEILGDDPSQPLPIATPLVRAVGLEALGLGEEVVVKSPIAIVRWLRALDDATFRDVWDAISSAYDEQHWPPRLLAPVACPKCGARRDVEPVPRPLEWAPPAASEDSAAEFPALEEFKASADRIMHEVFADRGITAPRGLEVIVDDDVPPVDDGGVALLGAYSPYLAADGDVRAQTSPFVITLYYRTFRSQYNDHPYDVDDEIRETIDHELEHHFGFVQGDDPLDDEERDAIAAERRRIVGGSDATDLAAGAGWLASDLKRFTRSMWPLLIVVLAALLIVLASSR